jgi:hypothetical protein
MIFLEFDDYQHLRELLPASCVQECSYSGDNESACSEWVNTLNLKIPREKMIRELSEFCWSIEDLEESTDKELKTKYLWIAAGCEIA